MTYIVIKISYLNAASCQCGIFSVFLCADLSKAEKIISAAKKEADRNKRDALADLKQEQFKLKQEAEKDYARKDYAKVDFFYFERENRCGAE